MRRIVAVAWALGVVLLAPKASGDEAASKREAQQRFAEGVHAYDVAEFKHDPAMYEAARQAFEQAYALSPTDRVLWNLALAEVDSGHYLKGLGHFRLYDERQHVSSQPTHPKFNLLHEYLVRALNATAHITVDAAAGTPIVVDGQPVGASPVPTQDVEPGAHVVEGLGQRLEIQVTAGQIVVVTVLPRPTPPPAPPAPTVVEASGPRPAPVVAPAHTARDVVSWSSTGVAVAAVGVGVGFLVDANARARDVGSFRSSHPAACASMQSAACQATQTLQSHYSESATISQVSFVVGAIAAVGAAAAWTVWPGPVHVTPEAGDRQAGLLLTGAF